MRKVNEKNTVTNTETKKAIDPVVKFEGRVWAENIFNTLLPEDQQYHAPDKKGRPQPAKDTITILIAEDVVENFCDPDNHDPLTVAYFETRIKDIAGEKKKQELVEVNGVRYYKRYFNVNKGSKFFLLTLRQGQVESKPIEVGEFREASLMQGCRCQVVIQPHNFEGNIGIGAFLSHVRVDVASQDFAYTPVSETLKKINAEFADDVEEFMNQ
jgi:hypothetical protein